MAGVVFVLRVFIKRGLQQGHQFIDFRIIIFILRLAYRCFRDIFGVGLLRKMRVVMFDHIISQGG